MVLPREGKISLESLRVEFNKPDARHLEDFRGITPAIPTLGSLRLSHFYGTASPRNVASVGEYLVPLPIQRTFSPKKENDPEIPYQPEAQTVWVTFTDAPAQSQIVSSATPSGVSVTALQKTGVSFVYQNQ